jgi:hypothetical protein
MACTCSSQLHRALVVLMSSGTIVSRPSCGEAWPRSTSGASAHQEPDLPTLVLFRTPDTLRSSNASHPEKVPNSFKGQIRHVVRAQDMGNTFGSPLRTWVTPRSSGGGWTFRPLRHPRAVPWAQEIPCEHPRRIDLLLRSAHVDRCAEVARQRDASRLDTEVKGRKDKKKKERRTYSRNSTGVWFACSGP